MRQRLTSTFKAFTYPDFRLMWAGAFASSIGTWMQKVAQNWLIFTMTGSGFWLALDAFISDAPILLFSLLGGVFADRVDRRRIMLASQFVQLSSAFLLAGLVLGNLVQIWMILALSFVVGLATSFGAPAYQALIPSLVDSEHLQNAVVMNGVQFNLARVIGPVLAGIAFYKLGAAACFGLNGISFLAPVAALLLLKRGGQTVLPAPESVLQSLKSGLRVVGNGPLKGVIGLGFAGSFCSLPLVTFLPVFARDVFHRDAKNYTLLLALFGVGAVAGAIGVSGIGRVRRKGLMAVVTQMTFGALMAGFALSRTPLLSYILLFFAGVSMMIIFAMLMTLVQENVADSMRGRVVSVYSLAFRGAMPLGNLAAAAAVTLVSAPTILVTNGVVLLAVGSIALMRRTPGGVTSL